MNTNAPTPSSIKNQLQKIITSEEFHVSDLQVKMLSFVVLETIEGRAKDIRGYTIAIKVLGRNLDFDPVIDPIVSMHARKIREALERYYLVAGTSDEIRIEIPKGSYIPSFTVPQNPNLSPTFHNDKRIGIKMVWPQLFILPFKNLSEEKCVTTVGNAIRNELLAEISISKEIDAYLVEPESKKEEFSSGAFFLVGEINADFETISISINLKVVNNDARVFSQTIHIPLESAKSVVLQKEIAGQIAAIIAGENGEIIKHLILNLKKEKIEEHTPHEAILRYYIHTQNSTPENGKKALETLTYITEIQPNISLPWCFLGRLYTEFHSFGVPGFEHCLDLARSFIEKGICIDPNNQRALMMMGYNLFIAGEIESAVHYLDRAINTYPNSIIYLDLLGYLTTVAGEWEKGIEHIQKIIKINPNYSPIVHYALWLNSIRQKNYKQAYTQSTSIIRSSLFWYQLVSASTLSLLGRYQEGKKYFLELLKIQPDFLVNGRRLIKFYIKPESCSERVIQSLEDLGFTLSG